jgi:hypothetical protein
MIAKTRHIYRDVEQKLEEGIAVDSRGGLKNNTLLCEAACHGHHVSLTCVDLSLCLVETLP